jgi:hypothetical protein
MKMIVRAIQLVEVEYEVEADSRQVALDAFDAVSEDHKKLNVIDVIEGTRQVGVFDEKGMPVWNLAAPWEY